MRSRSIVTTVAALAVALAACTGTSGSAPANPGASGSSGNASGSAPANPGASGSNGGAPANPGASGSSGNAYGNTPHAVFKVHANITGWAAGVGDYTVADPDHSCADLSTDTSFGVPDPGSGSGPGNSAKASIGSHTVSINAGINSDKYHGPGTYALSDFNDDVTMVNIDGTEGGNQAIDQSASGTIKVKADASGEFDFGGWVDPGGKVLGGTVTWTCADQTN